jgi:type IV pilus modification protein PilV
MTSKLAMINKLTSMKYSKGISLIEVLVTALVLAVGLLGVAALQLTSINSSQEGYHRSQATEIAESLVSKMRAAKLVVFANGNATTLADVIAAYVGAPYNCPAPVTSCITGQCNPAETVAFDRWEACNLAQTELPNGSVYVQNVAGIRVRVAVAWTPTASRQDQGQIAGVVNANCASLGVPATQDCVILEVVP